MTKKFTAKDIADLKGNSLLNLFIVENKFLISIDLKKKKITDSKKEKLDFICLLQHKNNSLQPLSFI